MKLIHKNTNEIENGLIKTNLFSLYETHLIIGCENEMKIFQLDKISNIRFSQKRNYSLNILFFFITTSIFYFLVVFLGINFILNRATLAIIISFIAISIYIKNFDYKLFINFKQFGYREFKISKNDISSAKYLVDLLKMNRLVKNNQNQLDFNYSKFTS